MEYPFTINKRLFSELFARHRDTFVAFCELLNNALQAEAKEIRITLTRSPADRLSETLYESITIRDNGVGVSKTEFRWKILEIATDAKEGGKGIGRFAALQLGAAMRIETVAFDLVEKCFYQTAVTINSTGWDELKTLDKIRLDVEHNKLEEQKPYYEVKITNFYGDTVTRRDTHKRVHKDLTPENIEAALFARYADTIVRKATKFIVNDKLIDPANYVIGDVESIAEEFMALDGSTHPIRYQFMLVKSTEGNHRIFLRVENSGIQTVAQTFNYDVDIPEDNRWFVFVDSPYFDSNSDPFRNLVLSEGLDPNATHLLDTIKSYVDTFLAKRYEHYRTFLEQLKADEFYPYKEKKSSSQTRAAVFNQLAYHVETEHRLLNAKNKVRRLVYNLIDRSLSSRDFEGLLADTIKLDDQIIARFRTLLERVDLDDVITFSDEVASKMQFLDFLHTLVYGAPSKYIKERSQLHKIVQRHLWMFGENYNGTPILFSDKKLENNIAALREKFFNYEPAEKDGNQVDVTEELRTITDLFFFNEKILDDTRREVMVVELKAPKVKLHTKELNQAEQYAFQIQESALLPS